jgi:phage FluMu protein Com
MAVQKELSCQHCKKTLPFGVGFQHDEKLNFICSHCKKVIFAVTEEAEAELKKCFTGTTSRSIGFSSSYHKEPLPISLDTPQEIQDKSETEASSDDNIMDGYGCFC